MSAAARVALPAASGTPAGAKRGFALAVLLSCAFAFTGLFHPLRAADEPRVAGIAWEMAHTGNVLVPHLGGEPFLEHPPGYYALLAGTIRLSGSSEGMARVPTAFGALATLLLTFDLARRMADVRAGMLAVCVLASMRGFFKFSHKVMVDSWLCAAVTLGYWAYARAACEGAADEEPRRRFVLLFYAAGVLAFLLKGPVGVFLLAGPVVLHAFVARRSAFLRSRAHVPGLLLLAAGCAAWPAALFAAGERDALGVFLLHNVLYRIAPGGTLYVGGHEQPPWFYLLDLPAVVGAWIAVLPAFAAWGIGGAPPRGWNAAMIRFAALVFPVGLVLLSLPVTKRGVYLLPALPPLAASIGAWLASTRLVRGGTRIERATLRAGAALAALLLAVAAALAAAAAALARRAGAGARAQRLNLVLCEARAGARLEARGAAPGRALQQLAALAFAGALLWSVALRGSDDAGRDLRPAAVSIAALASEARPVVAYRLDEQMRGALPFYTGLIPRNLGAPQEVRRFLAASPRGLVLRGDFPEPGFEAEFPELREIRSWPTAEGVYRVYELGAEILDAQGANPPAAGAS